MKQLKEVMRYLFKYFFIILNLPIIFTPQFATNSDFFSAQSHSKLNLHKLPFFKLSNNDPIIFSHYDAYQQVIDRWQNKLTKCSQDFFESLYNDLQIIPEQVFEQLNNTTLAASYHKIMNAECQTQILSKFIHEDDADPEIINFIRYTLQKYTSKKNILIVLTDLFTTLTATYGSDLYEHIVFCNINIYTKENIKTYYSTLNGGKRIFYIEPLKDNAFRFIDLSNLLIFGLTEAACHIEHQTMFLDFLITRCRCHGSYASKNTIKLVEKLHEFLGLLEAVFQSPNPLESAIFIMKSPHRDENSKKALKTLIKDIATSYSKKSLEEFKACMQKLKEQS